MALTGSLRTLSLGEIFQTLARSQATGLLRLSSAEGRCDVVFAGGNILGLLHHEEDQEWSIIERLAAFGVLSADHVQAQIESGGHTTIQSMQEQGLITAEQVEDALYNHVFDELCDLFTWENANFVFIEEEDEEHQVAEAIQRGLAREVLIDVNSLLMESARRLDEWQRILPDLPPDDSVVAIVPGREEEIEQRFSDYPERPVMTMVDGVRTIGEITHETPITHMDVHTVLFDAVCEGVLEVLTAEEMETRGADLIRLGDPSRAVRLLRSCLALEPERDRAVELLAEALDQAGDAPEAADCHAQLAISHLQHQRPAAAVESARRAVAINPNENRWLILVRCLLEAGETSEAVEELHRLAAKQAEEERPDEARGTLRKVLQLDPENTAAKRELAQLLEGDDSDDKVVCVECGEPNPRDQEQCQHCQASLYLTCLSCERAVAISDKICVFCGANPHLGKDGTRGLQRAGPSTTALIRKDDVEGEESGKHDTIRQRMRQARRHEEAEEFQEALDIWQGLSREQQGNARLNKHIRELQQLVHDQVVEAQIERGHVMRRSRRYHRAVVAYRKALRAISPEDPRSERLQQLIATTSRNSRITLMTYGAAFAILLLVAWLVVQPIYAMRDFEADVHALQQDLDARIPNASGIEGYRQLKALITPEWDQRAGRLGEEAQALLRDVRKRLDAVRIKLAGEAMTAIEGDLSAGDWRKAASDLQAFESAFGLDLMSDRRKAVRKAVKAARAIADEAPARLEAALAAERAGRFHQAWEEAGALVAVLRGDRLATAQALRERLDAARAEVLAELERLETLAETDLVGAREGLAAIAERAAGWQLQERHENLTTTVGERLAAARSDFEALEDRPTIADLERFLAEHPAAPQAPTVRSRLALLKEQSDLRQRRLETGLEDWQDARRSGDLEGAWIAARALFRTFPDAAKAKGVVAPLRIATGNPASLLEVDGEQVAAADDRGIIVWWHADVDPEALRIAGESVDPVALDWRTLEPQWDHRVPVQRSLVWSWRGTGPVHRILATPDGGCLAVVGQDLVALDATGEERFRRMVGSGDDLASGRPAWAHVTIQEELILAPLGSGGVLLLDMDGGEVVEVPGGELIAPPVLYRNDLKGTGIRMAFAAERLHHGPIEPGPERVDAVGEVIAGPAVVASGVDRLLVAATLDGRLVAVDDNQGDLVWDLDILAAAVGRFHRPAGDRVMMVLDGSRVADFSVGLAGGRKRWERRFEGPVVGEPQVGEDGILVTAGRQVLTLEPQQGTPRVLVELPGPGVVPAVAYGPQVTACYQDEEGQTILHYRSGEESWRRRLSSSCTGLVAGDGLVLVGTAQGQVLALRP